ncbi:MAG: DUF882 domain-containing protein [Granulosicoccus sp.]|nr:DUF882 domain-containing protein [Granulosicoccus sp.]
MTPSNNSKTIQRRRFLGLMAGSAAILATTKPRATQAKASAKTAKDTRALSFYNTHTRETLDVVYFDNGKYDTRGLRKLNKILRDHRQNELIEMDTGLYEQLWTLQQKLGSTGVFQIISGYRSPKTNSLLRKKSSGVAKKSYHMQGRAIDVRLTDVPLRKLRSAALKMGAGGVGYYPASDFIHLDTGPVRSWGS